MRIRLPSLQPKPAWFHKIECAFAVFCCATLLASCAIHSTQQDATDTSVEAANTGEAFETGSEQTDLMKLKQIVAMQNRLDEVGGRLLIGNADLCRKQLRKLLGFSVANQYSYSAALAPLASQTYGLDDRLQVMSVLPGSGAERAGLQHGDILVRIENKPVPQGIHAERDTVAMLSSLVAKNKSLALTVLRQGTLKKMTVSLTPACGFSIELGQTADVNAYSDGNRILITRGMMRIAQSDENLAYVISKEMAHNVLGHAKTLQNTRTATALIDDLIQMPPRQNTPLSGLKPMPKKFDIDADTLSLAMSLRGGYSIDGATQFWKKLAEHPSAAREGGYTALHPATAARLEAMPNAITHIKAIDKRRRALAAPQ